MKASIRWISEILGKDVDAHVAAERLTLAGVEIDDVREVTAPGPGIVSARVIERRQHPAKTSLFVVDVHDGSTRRQVVCGAPNTPGPGAHVVLALPGTALADGRRIETRPLSGVESSGMLCSEAELGIGPDFSGILILEGDPRTGTPLGEMYDLSDWILEFSITPNRPDCLGHVGLAREVAAVFGMEFSPPLDVTPSDVLSEDISALAHVRIDDPAGCPRYAAAVLRGVKVKPSPFAVRHRLHVLGTRPISNIVDVTNLILLLCNQPLHAFDLRLLPGGEIVVRRAAQGETIVTLDDVERRLLPSDLVIASRERPVAIAGVMGGQGTAIGEDTTDVLIECAYFDPNTIRRTSARLHLQSESSYRFERGTDPGPLPGIVSRAAAMMIDMAGGRASRGIIDACPSPIVPARIPFRMSKADRIVGTKFDPSQCRDALVRIGCSLEPLADGETGFTVTAPTHRPDLTREIDIVEEVARLRGYDTIEATRPFVQADEPRRASYDLTMRVKRALAAAGLDEVISLSFTSSRMTELLGMPGTRVALANPLNADRDVMRTSLLPGLLDLLCYHVARSRNALRVFEVGNTFARGDGGVVDGVIEAKRAAGLVHGPRPCWVSENRGIADFNDAWGALRTAARSIWNVDASVVRFDEAPSWLHPRSACRVMVAGLDIGWVGELNPLLAQELDLPGDRGGHAAPVGIFEIGLAGVPTSVPRHRGFSEMPSSERDLAMVFPERVEVGSIVDLARQSSPEILESVDVFDIFRGGQIPAGEKSVAFRMCFRAPDRTLRQAEVDEMVGRIADALTTVLGGKVRS